MAKLSHEDLYSLEEYSRLRPEFRQKVMAHKKNRRLPIGPNAALYFEDSLTMQYQVQEMLRIERIFEHEGIQDELDVYNPLIPDGSNWKATFMMEYDDPEERKKALAGLVGVENSIWVRVDGFDKVHPIANEDLERSTEDKTASVHFMRFELSDAMVSAIKQGASVSAGIDHANYQHETVVPAEVLGSLTQDLN